MIAKNLVGLIWKTFQKAFRSSQILIDFIQERRYSDLLKYSEKS